MSAATQPAVVAEAPVVVKEESNGISATNGAATEPMDVETHTNGVIKVEKDAQSENIAVDDTYSNGVVKDEGVPIKTETMRPYVPKTLGIYKVKVGGLPKFYPLSEFKKLIKEDLGLALNYIRSPKRGNPWVHLAFSTVLEQQKAVTALDKFTWRKRVLSCSVVASDLAGKRKPEEGVTDDTDAKKAKLDMSIEERVLYATIPLHNMPYKDQLKKKMDELKDLVVRLGDLMVRRNPSLSGLVEIRKKKLDGLPFRLDEILPSPIVDAYRNKFELRVGINPETQERTVGCRLENVKEGKIGVGPADSFKHLPQQIRDAVKTFQDYIRASDKAPFVVEQNEGYWRHLVVRLTRSGELMLVVVVHPQALSPEDLEKVKEDLKDFFINREGKVCNVASLYFQQFTEKLVGVPLPQMEHLYGKTHLEETVLGINFHLSPTSYFQVNTLGAEVLYKAIIELAKPTMETTVLDLCCGTGGIGLCVAKDCSQVFGIEYLVQNIEDAKFNAEKNGITNCEFITGRVEDILPSLKEKITGKTIVPILDPPRTGLNQKVLCQLRTMENVKKMIYVCCNHKAPIRNFLDLCCPEGKGQMVGQPFIPTRTIPVDVAPHTLHAQMVILMERVDPVRLPKHKGPLARLVARKPLRGGAPPLLRARGGPRIRGLLMPRGRAMGMFRGRGPPLAPLLPPRGGYLPRGRPMPMRPPPPPLRRPPPPMRPRPMDFEDDYRRPLRDFGMPRPPPLEYAPPPPPRRMNFSSDELTLSRYSDFRRDVEDAIDSSYAAPRPLSSSFDRVPYRPSPAAAERDMLDREEMAYQAGLTRGLVGSRSMMLGSARTPSLLPPRGLSRPGSVPSLLGSRFGARPLGADRMGEPRGYGGPDYGGPPSRSMAMPSYPQPPFGGRGKPLLGPGMKRGMMGGRPNRRGRGRAGRM